MTYLTQREAEPTFPRKKSHTECTPPPASKTALPWRACSLVYVFDWQRALCVCAGTELTLGDNHCLLPQSSPLLINRGNNGYAARNRLESVEMESIDPAEYNELKFGGKIELGEIQMQYILCNYSDRIPYLIICSEAFCSHLT